MGWESMTWRRYYSTCTHHWVTPSDNRSGRSVIGDFMPRGEQRAYFLACESCCRTSLPLGLEVVRLGSGMPLLPQAHGTIDWLPR
jgi:hypothetical protein